MLNVIRSYDGLILTIPEMAETVDSNDLDKVKDLIQDSNEAYLKKEREEFKQDRAFQYMINIGKKTCIATAFELVAEKNHDPEKNMDGAAELADIGLSISRILEFERGSVSRKYGIDRENIIPHLYTETIVEKPSELNGYSTDHIHTVFCTKYYLTLPEEKESLREMICDTLKEQLILIAATTASCIVDDYENHKNNDDRIYPWKALAIRTKYTSDVLEHELSLETHADFDGDVFTEAITHDGTLLRYRIDNNDQMAVQKNPKPLDTEFTCMGYENDKIDAAEKELMNKYNDKIGGNENEN